jgi:hypothetical protein
VTIGLHFEFNDDFITFATGTVGACGVRDSLFYDFRSESSSSVLFGDYFNRTRWNWAVKEQKLFN